MRKKGKAAAKKILDVINAADHQRSEEYRTKVTPAGEDKLVRCENCREEVRPNGKCIRCGNYVGKDGGVIRIGGGT